MTYQTLTSWRCSLDLTFTRSDTESRNGKGECLTGLVLRGSEYTNKNITL